MDTMVIAQTSEAATALCAWAAEQSPEVTLVYFGDAPGTKANRVLQVSVPEGEVIDDGAATVQAYLGGRKPRFIIGESSRSVKTVLGKLAFSFGTSVLTDVVEIDETGAWSLYFGGLTFRKRQPLGGTVIFTLSPVVSAKVDSEGTAKDSTVDALDWVAPPKPLRLIAESPRERQGVDLSRSSVIVGAGRGFNEEEKLDLARALCEKIDGGLGCSRPLTEGSDWLPKETYIGVSGLMIAPKVYVACGISGQMQHMVGIDGAETIFAINKDKDAPIFNQCDYGLVGSLEDVLPAVIEAL